MALTPFQVQVQQLARSMGLKGAAEQQVYNTPEYQALVRRYYPTTNPGDVSAGQQASEQQLWAGIMNKLNTMLQAPSLDLSPFQQRLDAITNSLMAPAQLPSLQPGDIANFDAIKAAQQGLARQSFEQDQGKLLAGLFGSGVNTSTIATDAVGRMLQNQTLIGQQIESDDAARRLAAQQGLAQLMQGNLALAGQNVLGEGNMAVAGYTSGTDALQALMSSLAQQQGIGLQRAGLNEGSRMNMLDLGEKQREFDVQQAAQRRSWLSSLIGMGASLATAAIPGVGPFLSGAVGSIFNKQPFGKNRTDITGG